MNPSTQCDPPEMGARMEIRVDNRRSSVWTGLSITFMCVAFCLGLWPGHLLGEIPSKPRIKYRGEIIVSVHDAQNLVEGYERLADAYRKHQPEVEVIFELKGNSHGFSYDTWLNTQLASGSPRPDIVSGNYSPQYPFYVNFDYYADQINAYTGRPWSNDLSFDFFRMLNDRGEQIMLATQMVKVLWYYNLDVFERLELEPPQTWNEFIEVCQVIEENGVIPVTLRFNYRTYQWLLMILWDQYTRSFVDLIRAQPGDWCFDPGRDRDWIYDPRDPLNDAIPTINYARYLRAVRDWVLRFDTEPFMEVLKNLKAISNFTPDDFIVDTSTADMEAYNLFLNQQAAMHLDASELMFLLDSNLRGMQQRGTDSGVFRWSTFDPPSQTNEMVAAPARSIESASGQYISIVDKNQPRTDRALDFVMFWLSPEGYQAFVDGQVKAGEFSPAGKIMIKGIKVPDEFHQLEKIERRGNAEMSWNYFPYLPRLRDDFKQALASLFLGRADVEETAYRIQSLMVAGVSEWVAMNNYGESYLEHPEIDPRL